MKRILASAAVAGTMLAASVLPAFADDNHSSVNIQGDNNGTININNGTINNNNITVNLTDISGHWAQSAIERLVKSGVLHGDENHHFNPDKSMKRDEFAVMVSNYFHLQNNSTTQDFADVSPTTDPGTWCFNAVEATKNYMTYYQFPSSSGSSSSVSGSVYQSVYSNAYFLPEQDVQRQQVATTLVKLLEAAGKLAPVSSDQASSILSDKFKDASSIAPDLRVDVATAVYSGLMIGDQHSFRPDAGLTRAEAAILLTRLQDNMQAAPGTPVNVAPVTIVRPTEWSKEDYDRHGHDKQKFSDEQ